MDSGIHPTSLPQVQSQQAPSGNVSDDGKKKQILQKLIQNLLDKPGRSFHEMMNGIKSAIGAYKNYSKEWDNLSAIRQGNPQPTRTIPSRPAQTAPSAMPTQAPQRMPLPRTQAPKFSVPTEQAPTSRPSPGLERVGNPPINVTSTIAGPSQESTFNKPAPINRLGIFGH